MTEQDEARYDESVSAIAWSPDGGTLAVSTLGRGIVFLDPVTLSERRRLTDVPRAGIAYMPDGSRLAVAGDMKFAAIVDIDSGVVHRIGKVEPAKAVAVRPDGREIAAASSWGDVRTWELSTNAQTNVREGGGSRDDAIYSLGYSPSGDLLLAGSCTGIIWRWSVHEQRMLPPLEGHRDEVMSFAFSPNGRVLASGAFDCTVHLWDVASGALISVLRAPDAELASSGVPGVAWSPDGRTLATAHPMARTLLWDTSTFTVSRLLNRIGIGSVGSQGLMFFSPDGRTLAIAHGEAFLFFHDMASGQTRELILGDLP